MSGGPTHNGVVSAVGLVRAGLFLVQITSSCPGREEVWGLVVVAGILCEGTATRRSLPNCQWPTKNHRLAMRWPKDTS